MKKYVIVGCGGRGVITYAVPLVQQFSDCGILCGAYDINPKRAALVSSESGQEIPVFTDFDQMLEEVKPDVVIVTPRDCDHAEYVIRAVRAGCDVIVEKALATTFEDALAIRKAQAETGKQVTVTFNLRHHPLFVRLKELVASGVIGDILHVHFDELLNTTHGADYFRRWHRRKEYSGSLLVHKATHHFDIVNWLLEEKPLRVSAFATLRYYGPNRAERGERCLTCQYNKTCRFFQDIKVGWRRKFYYECEDVDGYIRDRCVFGEDINIEDSAVVNVAYSGGAILDYSLTAHSPYEGMHIVLNGTEGRMEVTVRKDKVVDYSEESAQEIAIYNRRGEKICYQIPTGDPAGHGGADENLLEHLFRGYTEDPLNQMADTEAGIMSVGIGIAANLSIAEKRQVDLGEFFEELR